MSAQERARLLVLLPSLRISGGVREVLRLSLALRERGVDVTLLVLWKHAHESAPEELEVEYLSHFAAKKSSAAFQMAALLLRFPRFVRRWARARPGPASVMATHFTTLPFLSFAPRHLRRWCFQQDLEWLFAPPGLRRALLKRFILRATRRARLVTSNAWVSAQYRSLGMAPLAQASTWAEAFWLAPEAAGKRTIDIVMLLRLGQIKRLDLYAALLRHLRENTSFRCAIATSEDEAYRRTREWADVALLRPTNEELRALYGDAKTFVLLSDTEGFALPPLEAMGSGCVPLCRDSGGPRGYLAGLLVHQLISPETSMPAIARRIERLLADQAGWKALSSVSRQVFREGLARSEREREACFDTMARELAVPVRP